MILKTGTKARGGLGSYEWPSRDLNKGCPTRVWTTPGQSAVMDPEAKRKTWVEGMTWHQGKLALGYSKGTHFLSMQQTLLCALQVTPKAVQSPQSLQVSLGPVTSAWVNPAALCNRKGLAPQTWCTNWEIHKNFKRSEAQPFSPHQRRAAKIWKTSLLTPPGTRVAMDTTSPAWCFFCPLVLKLLCSSVLTHAGKEDFSPHLPKTSPQNTKSIWGLRAGRAHCAPFLLLNHWFLSNSFVLNASCVFINVRVYASTIVHLKSMYLHTHAVHLGLQKGDQEAN